MDTGALATYVTERIRAGVTRAEVREELSALGWNEEESDAAYRSAIIALGAPVPTEGNRATLSRPASTVDAVINFFSFILLGIIASALGTLLFQIINLAFPDALDMYNFYGQEAATSAIHYSIAALLIGFPLYYFALRLWFRKFREDEGRVESKLSKWLTYLVLLVTAVTMVGDLITVVFTMLQGEITVRFFLKALTILVIISAIFGFYYLERRKIQYKSAIPERTFQYFGRGVAVFIVVSVVLGFFAGGSPTKQRDRTFDQTRAQNLSSLASCIEQYATNLGALPTSLVDLRQSSQYSYCTGYMQDPETTASYEYRVVTPSRVEGAGRVGAFELCANFTLSSPGVAQSTEPVIGGYGDSTIWQAHGTGRSCDIATAQLLITLTNAQTPDTSRIK